MNFKKNSELRESLASLESQNSRKMGKKPRIHDNYGILESVAWIWRWLGVFPFTIKYAMGVKSYGINKFYAVYSIIICSSCFLSFTCSIIQFHEWTRNGLSIEHVTIIIRTIASLLCLFFAGIWRIIRHKELIESIETMATQDIILEKLGSRLNHESKVNIIRAHIWISLITVIIFVAYDFYATAQVMESVMLEWIFWSLPLVIQVIDLTILVSLVGLLGLKFRALNEKLRRIAIRANATSPKVIVISNVCANNLQLVAKAHYNICAVGKRINQFFSWEVIINVVTAFIILSTTLYYIFVEVQRDDETNYLRIGTYLHWEFIHSVPIIVIVIICNWTTNQGLHSGKLIHEIRIVKADTRLYEAVKSFSLQLHHQKLEFNAGGFFPLNSTLLQTMVGNITTYLVILIQFQPKLDLHNEDII